MSAAVRRPTGTLQNALRANLLTRGPRQTRRRKRSHRWPYALLLLAAAGIAAYWYAVFVVIEPPSGRLETPTDDIRLAAGQADIGRSDQHRGETADSSSGAIKAQSWVQQSILRMAEGMLQRALHFQDGYVTMKFPGGDLPADRGTSADLVIRSLRGLGYDLQVAIQDDRLREPQAYPLARWKNKRPDPNIDHRRLANQAAFFKRYAIVLTTDSGAADMADYQPGDIVMWGVGMSEFPSNIGIVRHSRNEHGIWQVITFAAKEPAISGNHVLTDWPIRAHFRIDPARLPDSSHPLPAAQPSVSSPATQSDSVNLTLEPVEAQQSVAPVPPPIPTKANSKAAGRR